MPSSHNAEITPATASSGKPAWEAPVLFTAESSQGTLSGAGHHFDGTAASTTASLVSPIVS